jgi:hypothetical protein
VLLAALALAVAVSSGDPQPSSLAPPPSLEGGVFPATWAVVKHECVIAPAFRAYEYNPTFIIIRQSGCTHYEKPFLYLIFGKERALLLDTGAGTPDVKSVVMNVMKKWCERNGRESIPLVVAHTHNHSDHVAGDKQFQGIPDVSFVGAELDTAIQYWGFTKWPDEIIEYDRAAACSISSACPATSAPRSPSTTAKRRS